MLGVLKLLFAFVLLAQSGCVVVLVGDLGASSPASATPLPELTLVVEPKYSNAVGWFDFLRTSDYSTLCDGSETVALPHPCIHAGAMKKVAVPEVTSCSGLTLSDQLGAFVWSCAIISSEVVFTGRLKESAGLLDLISVTNTWSENRVSLSGTRSGSSSSTTWWSTPIEEAPSSAGSSITLNTPNKIYVVSSGNSKGITVSGNQTALVVKSGVRFQPSGSGAVYVNGVNRVWVEGRIQADTAPSANIYGLRLNNSKFSYLRNVSILSLRTADVTNIIPYSITGLSILGGGGHRIEGLKVADLKAGSRLGSAYIDGASVIGIDEPSTTSSNIFSSIAISSLQGGSSSLAQYCSACAPEDEGGAGGSVEGIRTGATSVYHQVLVSGVTGGAAGSGDFASGNGGTSYLNVGVRVNGGSGTRLIRVSMNQIRGGAAGNAGNGYAFGSTGAGGGSYAFGLFVASSTQFSCLYCSAAQISGGAGGNGGNSLSANPGGIGGGVGNYGLYLSAPSSGFFHQTAALSTAQGTAGAGGPGSPTGSAGTIAHYGIYLDAATNVQFAGGLFTPSTGTPCFVNGGTNPGLTGACSAQGASSFDLFSVSNANLEFLSRVESPGDSVNISDLDGAATYTSSIDWIGFESFFRQWGPDASSFVTIGAAGAWNQGSGRIYDHRLSSSSVRLRNRSDLAVSENDPFVIGQACPSAVRGNRTTTKTVGTAVTFLKNAVELPVAYADSGELRGDQDGFCESGEVCMYTPNMGAYQGHGEFGKCLFDSNGGLTNIEIWGFAANGI